jgi:hypothetical protein
MPRFNWRGRRAGTVLIGFLLGVLFVGLTIFFYTQAAREAALREAFQRQLDLPPDAFRLTEVADGRLRVSVRNFTLLDPAGDTVLSAPLAIFSVASDVLDGVGPIVLSDVELRDPFLRLVQLPPGEWNIQRSLRAVVDDAPVTDPADDRPIELRDVRISNGRILLATPWDPADPLTPVPADVRLAQYAGEAYRVRTARSVDGRLPLVRVGGPEGWRAEVASLTALLSDPDLRLAQLRGTFQEATDGVGFVVRELRTDRSLVVGSGEARTVGERLVLDMELRADPLHFADVRWITTAVPPEGEARFRLAAATRRDGRTAWALEDVDVVALDSRVTGDITVVTGADGPPAFLDTELLLDPLDLAILEAFELAERVPYVGQVRGRVATVGVVEGIEGPLFVDLVANVTPREFPEVPVSTVALEGGVVLGDTEGIEFRDLRVSLRPLQVAALTPLAPEQADLLRGTVRGSLRVAGSTTAVQFIDGELAYEVGGAAPTRLVGITGSAVLEPELRYDISAVAQPLALGTLAELVPAFPFERTALAGPVQVAGTADFAEFSVNLRGDVGAFTASGRVGFEDPLSFRVAGRLDALRPAQLVLQEIPLAGPVSGPFTAAGTTRDFRFDVDFTQLAGRFALAGRVQLPADVPPVFEVEGEVSQFRVGTLIGRTGLFLSPLSGRIWLAGGGLQPYAFDLDLRGPAAAFDVEGWYDPQPIPRYGIAGAIAGLDLRLVPGLEAAPQTNLVATVAVDGRGTTLDTFEGRFDVDATGSRIGQLPLQLGVARAAVEAGILRVDTLQFALAGTRLIASGAWGLTRPAPDPLQFALASQNLAGLTPVLIAMGQVQPQLAGALTLEGEIGGTVENPILDVRGSGRNLRYDGWRAASLALELDAELTPQGWLGQGNVEATDAVLEAVDRFQLLRVEAVASPGRMAVGGLARRDRATELALSGILELEGMDPVGIALQSLSLQVEESLWQLDHPATVRWGDLTGIEVEGLALRRTGAEEGVLLADGRLPPTGIRDFRVQAINVDVGELRRLVRTAPELDGVLTMEAVVSGTADAPSVAIEGRVLDFVFQGAAAQALDITASYAGTSSFADLALWQDGIQVATARGTIPMRITFGSLVPEVEMLEGQPVSATVVVDSIPAALVTALVPLVEDGAGVITGQLTVGGLLGSPEVSGSASIREGEVTLPELNIRYREIYGNVSFDGQTVLVETLSARSGGAASVSGTILLDDLTRPLLNLSANLNQFRAMQRPDVATVAVTGEAGLAGRYPTPTLTGRVVLSDGTLAFPAMGDEEAFRFGELDLTDIVGAQIPVDVLEPTFVEQIRIAGAEVIIGETVWVESPEMRIQIGGELLVSRFGPEEWQIFGDLIPRRGIYTLTVGPIIREFDVVSGRIEFFGTPDLNPSLDVVAEHRIRATGPGATGILTVQVRITGTAQFPRLTLTTDTQPPLPESEILSYLIFGRPTFALGELGGDLARQILVQEAIGGILAGQVQQLIRQAGLPFDYIRIRGRPSPTDFAMDPLGTTTIEMGWQIFPDVFWTVEWGVGLLFGGTAGESWGTSLEWQIDPQWSTRVAWEPLRRDQLLRRDVADELRRQFVLQLRRRWEYGVSPPDPAARAFPLPDMGELDPPPERTQPPPIPVP